MIIKGQILKRLIQGTLFGLVLVTLTIGCSDKKKSNPGDPGRGWWGGYGPGGPGYGGYGTVNGVAAGGSMNGDALVFLQYASQGTGGQMNGPVMVDGEVELMNGISVMCQFGNISLPPGRYPLVPYSQPNANFSGGMISNAMLVSPSYQEVVFVAQARMAGSSACGMQGMFGYLSVVQVNGMNCTAQNINFDDYSAQAMCGY